MIIVILCSSLPSFELQLNNDILTFIKKNKQTNKKRDQQNILWVRDCCLTPTELFFSCLMERTSYSSMSWLWGPLCTIPTCLLNLYSAHSLKQQSVERHVAPRGHIILISGEATYTKFISFSFDPIGPRTHDLLHSRRAR